MAERTAAGEFGRFAIGMAVSLAVITGVLVMVPGAVDLASFGQARPQLDLAPFLAAPGLIQVHLATVIVALMLGPVQFAMPKGTPGHRVLGWTWIAAMGSTAVSSLFIREINDGQLSPIHFFSFWTLVSLPLAVWFAKRGMIRAHRGTMVGLYIGLIIAGLLSAAPGRLTWDIFFG